MKRVIGIIQARLDSTRLPKKVLSNIVGKPMIIHLLDRAKKSKLLDNIVIATTTNKSDDEIERIVKEYGFDIFRGSQDDVLDRYYNAAKLYNADIIVRITGDCPLLDPMVVDHAVKYFKDNDFDYISNVIEPTYPDGLDIEVFSFNALEKAWKNANLKSEREHVTPYIKNPENFRVSNFKNNKDLSHMRWTVDEPRDLDFVREIYKRLYPKKKLFLMDDVLKLLEENPEIEKINSGIGRNEGYLKSLKEDERIR